MQLQLGPLVDVAIALCGLFIAISTVSSFVTEQIAVFLKLRGEKLFTGVVNLVFDTDLANEIFAHPLIDTTVNDKLGPGQRKGSTPNRPDYIDPIKFAAAFWDVLADASEMPAADRAAVAMTDALAAQSADRIQAAITLKGMRDNATDATGTGVLSPDAHFEDLRQVVNALPVTDKLTAEYKLKANALVLLATANNDYHSLLEVTGTWFNHQMDRVSGWYSRQTQYIVVACAAAIVFVSGLDTLEIARGLYASPSLLATAAGAPADEKSALALLRGDTFAPYFHPFFGLWHSADEDRRNELAYDDAFLADQVAQAQLAVDANKVQPARDASAKAVQNVRDALTAYQSSQTDDNQKKLAQAIAAAHNATSAVAPLEKTAEDDLVTAKTAAAALTLADSRRDMPGTFRAHWFGWLILFLAASLGAPFWFNLLGTFINVRSAGPKPQTANAGSGTTPSTPS